MIFDFSDYEDGILYTLTDEDNNEIEFQVLGTITDEEGGNYYVALAPYHENPEDTIQDNGEFTIMQRIGDDENDDCDFLTVEDDDLYDELGNAFIEAFEAYLYEEDETSDSDED